jgi:hypothetical protein
MFNIDSLYFPNPPAAINTTTIKLLYGDMNHQYFRKVFFLPHDADLKFLWNLLEAYV